MTHRLYNESLMYSFIAISGFFLRYFFNTLLSNHLSPAFYGDVSFSLQIFNLLTTILLLGRSSLVVKLLPLYRRNKSSKELGFLEWCGFSLFVNIIIFLILTIIIFSVTYLFYSENIHLSEDVHIIIWFLPLVTVYGFLNLILNGYQVYDYGIIKAFTLNQARWLVLLAFLAPTVMFVDNFKPIHAVLVYSLSYIFLFVISAIFFKRVSGNNAFFHLSLRKNHTFKTDTHKQWKSDARNLFMGGIIFNALTTVGMIIMETGSHIPGSKLNEDSVGFYAAILTITLGVYVLSTTTYTSFIGKLSTYLASSEQRNAANQANWSITRINIFFSLAYILFIICFGKFLLDAFGENFRSVYPELIMISFSSFFYMASTLSPKYLNFSGKAKLSNQIQLISLVLYCCLGYLLGYFFGLSGVCIASLCVWIFRAVVLHVLARYFSGCNPLGLF